jgi:hypothetical protein
MEIQVFDASALANAPARFTDADSIAQGVSEGFATLSTDKGRFTPRQNGVAIPGSKNLTELEAVIVAMHPPGRGTSRTYFGGVYDPNNPSEPVCSSDDGITPRADSSEVQHTQCGDCPQNQVGSGERAGTRACRYAKNLGVVIPSFSTDTVFQLRVSAQGIFDGVDKASGTSGLLAYATQLGAYRRIPQEVLTEISIADGLTGGVRFKAVGLLNDTDAANMVAKSKSPEVTRLVGPRPIKGAAPALPALPKLEALPKPTPVAEEPKPAPAPAPAPAAEPEPVVLAPKAQKAVVAEDNSADDVLKSRIASAFGSPKK